MESKDAVEITAIPKCISQLNDDLWRNFLSHLNVKDFASTIVICKHFVELTNNNIHPEMNDYWQYQCEQLCTNIKEYSKNIKSKKVEMNQLQDWKEFYKQLHKYMSENNIYNRQLKKNLLPIDLFNLSVDISKLNMNSIEEQRLLFVNPILFSIKTDNLLIFKFLTCNIIDINSNLFHIDIIINNSEKYNEYISCVNKNKYNYNNHATNILFECCQYSSLNILNFILNYSYFPNIKLNNQYTKFYQTPLIVSCIYGYIDIVKLLLNHPNMTQDGINMQDKFKQSPLYCTCIKNDMIDINDKIRRDIVLLLLNDSRIDANISRYDLNTPLMCAIENELTDIAILLIKNNKIDINLTNDRDKTALDFANEKNNEKVIKALNRRTDRDAGNCHVM